MFVTVEKVTTPAQAEELRQLRNQCREFMTVNPGLTVTKDMQRAFFKSQITTGRVKVLLLRYGGAAVAYGLLRGGHDGNPWMSCGVAAGSRGKSYGTVIVRAITELGHDLNPGQPVMLEVWQDNWPARRVYEKAGYRVTGERVRDGGRVIETWEHWR